MKYLNRKIWLGITIFGIFIGGWVSPSLAQQPQNNHENPSNSSDVNQSGANSLFSQTNESYYDDERGIGVVNPGNKHVKEETPTRFALVIGNAKYKNIPTLVNPSNDAYDMKQALAQLGFNVAYLSDARNRRVMTEAVREFGNNLMRHPNAVGLFFYAGHAMQINGVNYLIPVDAIIKGEADVEFETLNVNYLLQTMDMAETQMNIIIMDACRNNPFARSLARSMGTRFNSCMPGLAPTRAVKSSI